MNITFTQDENLLATAVTAVGYGLRSIGVHTTDAVNPRSASDVDLPQIGGDHTVLESIAISAANHFDRFLEKWNYL
jgi:hypothetical protein